MKEVVVGKWTVTVPNDYFVIYTDGSVHKTIEMDCGLIEGVDPSSLPAEVVEGIEKLNIIFETSE